MAKTKNAEYPPLRHIRELSEYIEIYNLYRFKEPPIDVEKQISQVAYAMKNRLLLYAYRKKLPLADDELLQTNCVNKSMISFILEEWQYSKQAYVFEKDFYNMLKQMNDFDVDLSFLEYMPYDAMYLEILGNELIDGVLIRAVKSKKMLVFAICNKVGNIDMTGAVGFQGKQNISKLTETRMSSKGVSSGKEKQVILAREVLVFMIHACLYLCAENADVLENAEHKKIHKPRLENASPKNKYSEVFKWDVGIRETANIRRIISQSETTIQELTFDGRKRPRQHWRKAHWHSYWVGSGDAKKKVLRFIAPILVNDIGDESPVVRHN